MSQNFLDRSKTWLLIKKSTILIQSSWYLNNINHSLTEYFHQVSLSLENNVDFYLLPCFWQSKKFWITLYLIHVSLIYLFILVHKLFCEKHNLKLRNYKKFENYSWNLKSPVFTQVVTLLNANFLIRSWRLKKYVPNFCSF